MGRKLAAHLGWPTKAAHVTEALGPVATAVHLHWSERAVGDYLLKAVWTPNSRPGPPETVMFRGPQLWVAPVQRTELAAARGVVSGMLLELACEWLKDAMAQGEVWQMSRHEAMWRLGPSAEVQVAEDDDIGVWRRGMREVPVRWRSR